MVSVAKCREQSVQSHIPMELQVQHLKNGANKNRNTQGGLED